MPGSGSSPARRPRAAACCSSPPATGWTARPAADTDEAADDGAPWRIRAILAFADPIRDGVRDALRMATEAGIQTIVVTGDHPATTAAIAAEAGLGAEHIVTGRDLEGWDDARLDAELPTLHAVARALPEQKLRLVDAAIALQPRIGEVFAAVVTGVTPKGTFVRVLNPPAEGLLERASKVSTSAIN